MRDPKSRAARPPVRLVGHVGLARDDPREETGPSDERSVLLRYLRNYRLTLQLKCDGLDAEQLARRSVPPSNMSLLGLVRHLATVEQYWFRVAMAGEATSSASTAARATTSSTTRSVIPPASRTRGRRGAREVANAEEYVEQHPDLDTTGPEGDVLREVLLHMVEEYSRHCGHADLLRERIDGRIGQ